MTARTLLKIQKGFTLIELIVVIGIIAILLTMTFTAINPAKQFGNASDTKRQSDIITILNAINQYMSDNNGSLPGTLNATNCPTATPCPIANTSAAGNICSALVTKYLSALPQDPLLNGGAPISNCATYNSGYQVSVGVTDNRVTIIAPTTYSGTPFTATR